MSGSGTVQAANGTVLLNGDATGFSGTVIVGGQGTFVVLSGADLNASASIDLNGGGSDPTYEIDKALNNLPQATISGFTNSVDVIDLRALSFVANSTGTPYSAFDLAEVTSGGSLLAVISGGSTDTLNLDPATAGSAPLNLVSDGNGGTDISFSVLSAGTASVLNSQIDQAAGLANGTFTVFLTSAITLTTASGGTGRLDPLLVQSGATVVLDGEGLGVSSGAGGFNTLSAKLGPVVVTSLGGTIGLDVADGARVTVTSNTFGGGITLTSGALEVVDSGGAGTGPITFQTPSGGHDFLQVDASALAGDGGTYSNTINDFATMAGQFIDLAGFTFSSATTSAAFAMGGSMLSVTNGASTAALTLGGSTAVPLHVFDDGNGGTIVSADSVACYVTGTRILTEAGQRPVEALAIGERVVTASGALRPIRWIGHRRYSGRFLSGRPETLPVRIRAGALADGVPMRDLCVSPKHAMFLDSVLVPAAALVNGGSVVRVSNLEEVGYWHVELDSHDILLAEGAWSESFVDDDSRGMFHNQGSSPRCIRTRRIVWRCIARRAWSRGLRWKRFGIGWRRGRVWIWLPERCSADEC